MNNQVKQVTITVQNTTKVSVPAWFPGDAVVQASNIHWLMQDQQLDSYDDLYQWSITERNAFWDTMVKRLGIRFQKNYRKALDDSQGAEHPCWLIDAKLNIIDSLSWRTG